MFGFCDWLRFVCVCFVVQGKGLSVTVMSSLVSTAVFGEEGNVRGVVWFFDMA